MKITKTTLTLLVSSFIILLNQSCSIQKRVHMGGYHIQWNKNNKQNLTKNFSEQNSDEASLEQNVQDTFKLQSDKSKLTNDKPIYFNLLSEKEIKVSSNDTICDNIILKNGEEISAKVIEISENVIKYSKCNNLAGPTYQIQKSEVLMVKYVNGTKDVFKNENQTPENKKDSRELNKIATLSFSLVFSGILIGLFTSMIFGLIICLSGAILGIISLIKISKNPLKYKGKGWAVAGFLLGLISTISLLFLISYLA